MSLTNTLFSVVFSYLHNVDKYLHHQKRIFHFIMEKSSFDVKAKALFYPPNCPESKNENSMHGWTNRDVEFSKRIFFCLF